MYSKKTIIIKQYDSRYALRGQLGGVLTLLGDGANAKCTLTLRNVDHRQYGLWRVAINADGYVTAADIDNLDCFYFSARCGKLKRVTVVIALQQDALHPVCYGGDGLSIDRELLDFLSPPAHSAPTPQSTKYAPNNAQPKPTRSNADDLFFAPNVKHSDTAPQTHTPNVKHSDTAPQTHTPNLFSKPADAFNKPTDAFVKPSDAKEDATEYEKFVLATNNYYDSEEGQRLLKGYKQAMDDFYVNPNGNFYDKVKGRLLSLFDSYPRSQLLMTAVENSLFVRIKRASGHFCLGLLIERGAPRYICYALPASPSQEPRTALDYSYIFQDAATGELTSRSF